MYPVFLPLFIEQNFSGTTAIIGILLGLTPLIAIFARFPMGRYIDRKGRKLILVTGAVIYVLTPVLYSLAPDTAFFGMFRLLQGVGIAAFTISSLAMVIDFVPRKRVGEAVGVFSVAQMVAMAIGPMISGGIVGIFGYIGTFYIIAGLSIIALVLTLNVKERFVPKEVEKTSIRTALKDGNLRSACIASFFLMFTYNVVIIFTPLYMNSLYLDTYEIGVFFSIYALATIVSRPFSGRLSDRIGRSAVVLPMMAVAVLAIGLLPIADGPVAFAVIAVLYGFGYGSSFAPLSAMAVDTVNPALKGSALAIYYSATDIGLVAGAFSMGIFAEVYGFRVLFGLNSMVLVVGIIAFALLSGHMIKKRITGSEATPK